MALAVQDQALLMRAITLAQGSIGLSEPNPRVGCVLHDAQGRLAGEGFTQQAGGPHAEVMALRAAAAAGLSLQGGTAWVSLEPCAHHGRTPPCADALVAAGLSRVVVATTDPYPAVAGQGIARLRAAGLQVCLAPAGEVVDAAHALNIGFFSRLLRGRPWLRMKVAASLDGRTALPDGRSQWITGPQARADGHAWRKRAGAVMTGVGTVLDDDPRMDVRLVPSTLQPLRIVLDSAFRTPPTARLLAPPGRSLVVGASGAHGWRGTTEASDRIARLQDAGASVRSMPAQQNRIPLAALLQQLAADGINELHLEAGATLNGAFWQAGLVDEVLLYMAPKLLGPGRGIAQLPELSHLSAAPALRFVETRMLGEDLALRLQPVQALDFLR